MTRLSPARREEITQRLADDGWGYGAGAIEDLLMELDARDALLGDGGKALVRLLRAHQGKACGEYRPIAPHRASEPFCQACGGSIPRHAMRQAADLLDALIGSGDEGGGRP